MNSVFVAMLGQGQYDVRNGASEPDLDGVGRTAQSATRCNGAVLHGTQNTAHTLAQKRSVPDWKGVPDVEGKRRGRGDLSQRRQNCN